LTPVFFVPRDPPPPAPGGDPPSRLGWVPAGFSFVFFSFFSSLWVLKRILGGGRCPEQSCNQPEAPPPPKGSSKPLAAGPSGPGLGFSPGAHDRPSHRFSRRILKKSVHGTWPGIPFFNTRSSREIFPLCFTLPLHIICLLFFLPPPFSLLQSTYFSTFPHNLFIIFPTFYFAQSKFYGEHGCVHYDFPPSIFSSLKSKLVVAQNKQFLPKVF